nr:hypothetical protein [Pseudofrankia asymbiotica]
MSIDLTETSITGGVRETFDGVQDRRVKELLSVDRSAVLPGPDRRTLRRPAARREPIPDAPRTPALLADRPRIRTPDHHARPQRRPYVAEDAVFGVKRSLLVNFNPRDAGESAPDGTRIDESFQTVDRTFVLARQEG